MNWLLIVILIVFLLMIIHGWRKGLLRILFSLIAILVLIGLVSFATPHVSGFLKEHTGLYTMIEERCTQKIQTQVESDVEEGANTASSVAGISLPEKVAAYLTDMRMPGMDGIETTKIIRTKNGKCMEVPIIAMTADGFETDISMLQKAGMNGLISKPVDVNTLVEHITKLAGW